MSSDVMSAWFVVANDKNADGDWQYMAGPFPDKQSADEWVTNFAITRATIGARMAVRKVRIAIASMVW
jgi:hypothetical protein